ncbi:hypothetical protein RB597_005208 [Gaeumannomyces tritici]
MASSLIGLVKQVFPGKPNFKQDDLPDLTNKVIIVTGSNTGVGKELAQILYARNAHVYVMARSEDKSQKAMDDIRAAVPQSQGRLTFLRLDLADLPAVKAAANEFTRREQRLDVLFHNAGVAFPEAGSRTAQGTELVLGVNVLGPFLLTRLLTPMVGATAALPSSPKGSVRVVWVASSAAEAVSPKALKGALAGWEGLSKPNQYFYSKLCNYLHAAEFAARHRGEHILSASLNPGNLDSELWRTQGRVTLFLMRKTILYPSVYGAYTCLFAGFSPEINLETTGSHVAPWGRLWQGHISKEMADAGKRKSEGGSGIASEFWDWSEEQIKQYL